MSRVGIGSGALALLALTGCELVGHLDARSVDPVLEGCRLPTVGDGRLRIANLRPDSSVVDFCVRSSGESYARPLLRGGGSGCGAGYRYADVSVPFAVRAGAVDVKMIAAGNPCAAPALAELQNVAVGGAAVVTIASLLGQAGSAQLVALPEEPAPDDSQLRLRFLNAIVGSMPLYLGPTQAATLPTRVTARLWSDGVPFGETPRPGLTGQVDDHGYLLLPSAPYQLGVASDMADTALLSVSISERPLTYSLFAIGVVADNDFPPRGLLCDETTPAAGLTLSCEQTALPWVDAGAASGAIPSLTGLDAGLGTRPGSLGASASGTSTSDADAGALVSGAQARDVLDGGAVSTPATSPAQTSIADAALTTTPFELTAQYELNPVAPSGIELAPVLRITNVSSREPIPLKSLTMRYYFTNEHFSECPANCSVDDYYDNLSLGMTVAAKWTYVQLEGKQACLEVSFPTETASLHRGESVQSFQGFHTTTWLPFDESDDYSYIANQTSFVDSQKITVYRDGVLVWGTPPP